jgi:hypothetical protein
MLSTRFHSSQMNRFGGYTLGHCHTWTSVCATVAATACNDESFAVTVVLEITTGNARPRAVG